MHIFLKIVTINCMKNSRKQLKRHGNRNSSKFFTRILYLGSFTLAIFFLINTVRSIQLTIEKLEILEQAKIDVEDLRLSNLELIQFGDLVKSNFYVELEGRDRLHLSQEDEYVIIISEELLNSTELEAYYRSFLPAKDEFKLRTGFKTWAEFFINGI